MGKTIIALTILIAGWMQPLRAQHKEVGVADAAFERNGSNIEVDFDIDLSRLDLKSTGAVLLTPRMVNGNDSVDLPSVGIYGRRRYYHYVRNGESMLTGKDETVLRTADCPDTFAYSAAVPYGEWMSGARLKLACYEYGCCNSILDEWMLGLGGYVEYVPKMLYVTPVAQGVKTDSITGTAYVIFEVDKTVLKPEIMDNRTEIGKINASIDTVRSDKDITILNVDLKGFASPESPYSHNADLAKGRVQALKTHLQRLHHFDEGVVRTGYEPENWEGLRRFVERSNLEHRSEILAMIDSGMEPDAKEAAIKRAYPDEYKFLLDNCYPSLRRTDYCIRYVVAEWRGIRSDVNGVLITMANFSGVYYQKDENTRALITPEMIRFADDASYAVLVDDAESNTFYLSRDAAETADIEAVNKQLKELGNAKVWKDGKTYYYTDIRHLGKITQDGKGQDVPSVGAYGVVRNHSYQVVINSVTGLGTPVYNPDDVIDPEQPKDEESYLAARIKVLSWRVVKSTVDLK